MMMIENIVVTGRSFLGFADFFGLKQNLREFSCLISIELFF